MKAGLPAGMAPVIAAQLGLESTYGKSAPGFNFGGIKADRSWTGPVNELMTTEVVNGQEVRMLQKFRAYGSPEEGAADYVRFITSNPRYRKALASSTPAEYYSALQAAGYATDLNYAAKLGQIYLSMGS